MTTTYHARWVLPITEPAIENGSVSAEHGRITYVGARRDAGHSVDLGDAILLPGLVNAHCHLELTAMRGFLEDLDFRRWILRLTSAKRAAMTLESLLDSARAGLEEGMASGITTYADTCDSGVVIDAMREYGVRGIMYQELFGPDPSQCGASIGDFSAKLERLRPKASDLIRVGISPHAPYTVSDDLFRASAALAAREKLPMAIHIAESEVESQLIVDGKGTFADGLRSRGIDVQARAASPVALLARLGVLEQRPLLIHCIRVDADDLDLIASNRSRVAHCPISNAKLGHGIAPLLEVLSAGIDVGIGSDSMASNNRMDLLGEARVALLMQRARIGTHEALSAADVLELVTMGGACALGLADEIGSLEVGKSADLAAFEIGSATPTYDPAVAAVFSIDGSRAKFVAVAGIPVVENGRLVKPNPGLRERVQKTADALRDWLENGGELAPPPPAGIR
jgi:cytosine/adenosine deaminase-related metal-dependent hydrolase